MQNIIFIITVLIRGPTPETPLLARGKAPIFPSLTSQEKMVKTQKICQIYMK